MWFKQLHVFNISPKIDYEPDGLSTALDALAFEPCLASLPSTMGWVSPLDEVEDAPLVHAANGYMMLCLQTEDKILPGPVVKHALEERIKDIEKAQARKVPYKEKQSLQADITATLLPRAFSRYKKLYAYIDTRSQQLILNTAAAKDVALFLSAWERVLPEYSLTRPPLKDTSYVLTQWLKHHDYPKDFAIEKACYLQDAHEQSRTIRCQQQNLTDKAIQALLNDGCQVKQLALSWQDRIEFKLADEFLITGLKFQDKMHDSEAQTKAEQFDVDFYMMTETVAAFMHDLLALFGKEEGSVTAQAEAAATAEAL